MESKWFWILLTVMLLEGWSKGCLEHERVALLQLKSNFFDDPLSLLNWVDVKGSDCCKWERVECSITSRRVIGLSLNITRARRHPGGRYGYLNSSLFLPFEELNTLHLTDNHIAGFVDNEGFERLSPKFDKLEILDLSDNYFNDSILASLSKLSSLKSLYLAGNHFTGSNPNHGFGKLSLKLYRLEILDLSDNYFNDSIFTSLSKLSSLKSLYLAANQFTGSDPNYSFKWLSGLNNLENLDLSENYLKNNFLLHVGGLSSLKTLNLGSNELNGSVDIQGFKWLSGLNNLENLDLSENYLKNNFLLHVGGLSSLETLNLGSNELNGSVDIQELNSLTNLRNLDLSDNEIERLRCFQDCERHLRLIKLEELDLGSNLLDNSILELLGGLSNLRSLHLGSNRLKGAINVKELEALNNLEELDLSYNDLNGSFLASKEIGSLKKLRVANLDGVFNFINESASLLQVVEAFSSVKTLWLGDNYLNKTTSTQEFHLSSKVEELILDYSYLSNNILESIGALTSLKTLTLSGCGLTGALPAKGWCDLRNLEEFDLSYNAFVGTFPSCLDNLTYLQFLDISNNHFGVPTSFISFANHSHLKVLLIDQSNLVGGLTFQTQDPTPKFQLKVFSMSTCTMGLPKELPNFLYYQYDLRYLELSYNNFGGKIPSWLLENNTRLEQFFLTSNSFMGPLQFPRHTNVDMIDIDMSQNKIQGQIPMNVCSTFPHLGALFLSQNAFEGNIPHCLGGLKFLTTLDLSYNNFSGGILGELAKSNSLYTLRLSNNNFSGKIVPTIFSSIALSEIYLDGNNFDGVIPLIDISTVAVSFLSVIDLSDNHLSGRIPRWIWNLSDLQTLDLSNNHLDGLIPYDLCNLAQLQFLDLSQNNLSGSLPSCFNPSYIQHVHLSRNRLSGPLTRALFNSSSLVTLDLSQNNLTGKIPYWIGTLSALSILLMKANHFEGEIPRQLCQLKSLSIMDLSQNKLFGHIPSCLSTLTLKPKDESFSRGSYSFIIIILEDLKFKNGGAGAQNYPENYVEEQVEFMTKKQSYTYSGNILKYMSGIDLSCNSLTGQIPPEIGNLSELHSLNLSHNNLVGFIPLKFSKLKQIESLDLSNNNLSGRIPMQLTELNSLEVFNVSYNNLSGSIPYKAQFATFDESSYIGNPFLSEFPLHKNWTKSDSPATVPNASDEKKESDLVDKYFLHVSFWVSYGMVLMVIATILYINPYWRQTWFYFIEHCITACQSFIVDNFLRLSMFKRSL